MKIVAFGMLDFLIVNILFELCLAVDMQVPEDRDQKMANAITHPKPLCQCNFIKVQSEIIYTGTSFILLYVAILLMLVLQISRLLN